MTRKKFHGEKSERTVIANQQAERR